MTTPGSLFLVARRGARRACVAATPPALPRPGGRQAGRARRRSRDGSEPSTEPSGLRPGRAAEALSTSGSRGRRRLTEVAQRLGRELGAPVVLDLAALDRQEIEARRDGQARARRASGSRPGLKLLLDQVGLTYRVVAEDNLLILTDNEGSEDPVEQMLAELQELHRDVHDLQDAVDELRDALGTSGPREGARVRKPTIIEEVPENAGGEAARTRTGQPNRRRSSIRASKPPGSPTSRREPGSDPKAMQIGAASRMQPGRQGGCRAVRGSSGEEPAGTHLYRDHGTEAPVPRDVPAGGRSWLSEPRTAVLIVLGGVVLIGGGRKLLQALAGPRAVARLAEPDVTPAEVEAVDRHRPRRAARPVPDPRRRRRGRRIRDAAGRAIAVALGPGPADRRGGAGPRPPGLRGRTGTPAALPPGLQAAIPITVTYGLPFLAGGRAGREARRTWNGRTASPGPGGRALEESSPWTPGPGRSHFTIIPGDFETNGPHRLVLQTRVRTAGLTDSWEIELPHIPFSFEFDPRLEVDSLLALAGRRAGRGHRGAVRLVARGIDIRTPEPVPAAERASWRSATRPRIVDRHRRCRATWRTRVAVEFDGRPGPVPARASSS